MALHFLKRDLRRAWWLYLVWFLLYAADGILAVSTPPSFDGFWSTGAARQLIYFPVLHLLVLAILVPQLVHEDALVGSTAFWLTLPVSRLSLLLAKTAALGLVVLIPVAVNTAALSPFGLSVGGLGLAALGTLAHQCSFVLPIAAVAALTPNFRWYGAAAAGLAVGIGVVLVVTASGIGGSIAGPFNDIALSNTRALIDESLLLMGGGLIFAHQYLTRRTRRSLAMAACVAGTYALVAGYWPWSIGKNAPIHSEHAPFDPSTANLDVMATSLNGMSRIGFSGRIIGGAYYLSGIPSDMYIQLRAAKATVTLPDGAGVRTYNEIPTFPSAGYSPSESNALAAALGGIPVYKYTISEPATNFAVVDNDTLQRFKDSPAKLRDDFDFIAGRYEVAAEVPIAKGPAFDVGNMHARISDVIPRADGVTLIVLESTVRSVPSSSLRFGDTPHDPRLKGDPVYLLVNRSRREAVPFSLTVTRTSAGEFYLGGMLFQEMVQMPFGGGDFPRAPVLDKQWLAQATFVCLERVPVFEFSKSTEIDLPKLGEPWLSMKTQVPWSAPNNAAPADISSASAAFRAVYKDGIAVPTTPPLPSMTSDGSNGMARALFPESLLTEMDHGGQASDSRIREIQLQALTSNDRQAIVGRLASQPKDNPEEVKQAPIYLGADEQKKEGVSGRVVAYLAVTREGNVAEVYVDGYSRPELAKSVALAYKYSRFKPSDHDTLVRRSFDLDKVRFSSGPDERVSNPALRDEILRRRDSDQQIRNEMTQKGAWDHPDEGLNARIRAIDKDNAARMRELLKQYGWPGPDLIGTDGTFAAWLLVQHADLELQSQALPHVHEAFLAKKLPGSCYALLLDRVRVGEGKPQVYGSQARPFDQWTNHTPALEPIEDEANVDRRRAEVGLGPLSEYVQSLKSSYFPNEK